MKKIITTTILTALASSNLFAQNVGIGTSAPNSSSKLEISSTNSGLLIPRVALTALNAAGPITAPATSLLVYNTATAGVAPNNVTPGYYYWTGTTWSRLLNSTSSDWTLLGNGPDVQVVPTEVLVSAFISVHPRFHPLPHLSRQSLRLVQNDPLGEPMLQLLQHPHRLVSPPRRHDQPVPRRPVEHPVGVDCPIDHPPN